MLVDPQLEAYARLELPDPEDTLVRIEGRIGGRYMPSDGRASTDPAREVSLRGLNVREYAVVAGTAAAVAILAVLVGVRLDFSGSPAVARSEAMRDADVTTPPTTGSPAEPAPRPAKAPRSRPARATPPRRFAWAPVDGATGYHVEFFRGDLRIFAGDTARPQLAMPATWRYQGATRSLRPGGKYRWYVWPVSGGRRASSAAVQTIVSIPAG